MDMYVLDSTFCDIRPRIFNSVRKRCKIVPLAHLPCEALPKAVSLVLTTIKLKVGNGQFWHFPPQLLISFSYNRHWLPLCPLSFESVDHCSH